MPLVAVARWHVLGHFSHARERRPRRRAYLNRAGYAPKFANVHGCRNEAIYEMLQTSRQPGPDRAIFHVNRLAVVRAGKSSWYK